MKTLASFLFFSAALFVTLFVSVTNVVDAGQPGLRREGDYWIESSQGSEAIAAGAQLRVSTIGSVVIRGGQHGQLTYTISRKFRARNEANARGMLQETGINITRQGRFVRLIVDESTGPVDLQINTPRSVADLIVTTEVGRVDISDLDGKVHAETGGGKIRLARIKGNVEVTSAGGAVSAGDIGGSLRVNTAGDDITVESIGSDAVLQTAGGHISLSKAGGSVRAVTAGGTIRIGQVGGAVIAETMGGQIEVGRAGGMVTVRNSGGGPIWIGEAQSARCDNASGTIKLDSVTSGARLSTAAGSVIAQLAAGGLQADSFLSTGAGDITVIIPSNVGVTIRARNDGAATREGIMSDFPGLQIRSRGSTMVAEGMINGGGPVLRISGNGGIIRIKRK